MWGLDMGERAAGPEQQGQMQQSRLPLPSSLRLPPLTGILGATLAPQPRLRRCAIPPNPYYPLPLHPCPRPRPLRRWARHPLPMPHSPHPRLLGLLARRGGGGLGGATLLLALEAKGSVSVLIPRVRFVLHLT